MWTRQDVKTLGKAAMKANYFNSVAAALLLAFCTGALFGSTGSSTGQEVHELSGQGLPPEIQALIPAILAGVAVIVLISIALDILLFNPLMVGCRRFFFHNLHEPAGMGELTVPLKTDFSRTVITVLLMDIYTFLWTMLLIVPGIIKSYSYMLTPYILEDHPEMTPNEAITRSREMMDGNKMKAFVLDLSFLGWHILGAVTCGLVTLFYTLPYTANTHAAVYEAIRQECEGSYGTAYGKSDYDPEF